jgi:hypothetical protein
MRWVNPEVVDLQSLEEGDVDGAVQAIRSASLRELQNENFLREEFLPYLGFNGEALSEFPESLYQWCGKGVRSWQYPVQFSRYLCYLSGRKINSYVEIGCRHGGTFIIVTEYIRRFHDLNLAVAMDIQALPIMQDYASKTVGVEYRIANSQTREARSYLGSHRWDLAFVDGDHSYSGCMGDFLAVRDNAKTIVLHDVASDACPPVMQAWQEIRRVTPSQRVFEAVDQYKEVLSRTGARFLGIGVVEMM